MISLNDNLKRIETSLLRKILDRAPENSINLALGEIRLPFPQKFKYTAKKIIDENELRYTKNQGIDSLRLEISKRYKFYKPDNILVTAGVEEGIFLLLSAFVKNNTKVLIPNISYPAYRSILNYLGAEIIEFNLKADKNFRLDSTDFQDKIKQNPEILLLNHPINPTGTVYKKHEIQYILNETEKKGILLIIDEIYLELCFRHTPSFSYYSQNVIILSGLSKSYLMTGWRLGWIACSENIIEKLITLHQYIMTCSPTISQLLAFELLANHSDFPNQIITMMQDNMKITHNFLQSLSAIRRITEPSSLPYLFIETDRNGMKYVDEALKVGVILAPGISYGDNFVNFIRINYCHETGILLEALDRLGFIFS